MPRRAYVAPTGPGGLLTWTSAHSSPAPRTASATGSRSRARTRTRTFAELGDRVTRIANGLLAQGLRPGDRVLDLQTQLHDLPRDRPGHPRGGAGPGRAQLPAAPERLGADRRRLGRARAGLRRALRRARPRRCARGDRHRRGGRRRRPGHVATHDADRRARPAAAARRSTPTRCAGCTTRPAPRGIPRAPSGRTATGWRRVVNMTHDVLGGPPGPSDCYVHAGPITHTVGPVRAAVPRRRRAAARPAGVGPGRASSTPSRDRGATHTALVPTMVARLLAMPGVDRRDLRGLKMLGLRRRADAAGADAPGPRPAHPQPRAVLRARRGDPAGDRPRRGRPRARAGRASPTC